MPASGEFRSVVHSLARARELERDMFGIGVWELLFVALYSAVGLAVLWMIVSIYLKTRKL